MFEQATYEEDVKSFKKIFSTAADQLLSKEELAIVYIGRATCPFCRKFARKLSGLTNEINQAIYYIESDNALDKEINSFREKYNILTVPGFIVSHNGQVKVRCDSSTPEAEILAMIK